MTDTVLTPQVPSSGGAYQLDAHGVPVLVERTIGPLDPEHPDQIAAAARRAERKRPGGRRRVKPASKGA